MAIIIYGQSTCGICSEALEASDAIVAFPAFVSNRLDVLYKFSDTGFHAACFWRNSLAAEAQKQAGVAEQAMRQKVCVVCNQVITDPSDYLNFGYLTHNPAEEIFRYNNLQFHRNHVAQWSELASAHQHFIDYLVQGKWQGDGLQTLTGWLASFIQ